MCGSGPSPPSNSTVSVASSRPCSDSQAEIAGRRALSACSSPSDRTYGFSSRATRSRCRYGSSSAASSKRVGLGIVEREPLELDEEEQALEVGGPVASERREIVRLRVHGIGVLAGRGVEVDAGDVLRELVELVEQLAEPLGAGRADGAAPPLGEVARAGEQLVPVAARLLRVGLEIAQVPTNSGGAEG